MPDWRWVTQVSAPNTLAHSAIPRGELGMWVDLDGVDTITPLNARTSGASTRFGWMTNEGWHYLFIAEQVQPITSQKAEE